MMPVPNGINGVHDPDPEDEDGPPDDGGAGGQPPAPDHAADVALLFAEIDTADFPRHFTQRDRRLFHSHGSSPYPLPVDTHEHNRLRAQHDVLRAVMDNLNYFGPVPEVLSRAVVPERPRLLVDFGTGYGIWLLDMAGQFPDVRFDGIDIVPIAAQTVPPNVFFFIDDISRRLEYRDGTVDVVHARDVILAVRHYVVLLREAARILHPGGLFLSGELSPLLSIQPPSANAGLLYPSITAYFSAVTAALASVCSMQPSPQGISALLAQSACFDTVTATTRIIPVGAWRDEIHAREVGRVMLGIVADYATSMQDLLRRAGRSAEEIHDMLAACLRELHDSRGLGVEYYAVHARRTNVPLPNAGV